MRTASMMTPADRPAALLFEGTALPDDACLPAEPRALPAAAVMLETDWPVLSDAEFGQRLPIFEAHLPDAARCRLQAFKNEGRRSQSLKARLGALLLAHRLLADLIDPAEPARYEEAPPFGPVIRLRGRAFFLTLAHTAGASAAAVSETPAGVDIERIRRVKRLADMTAFAYGEAAGSWMRRRLDDPDPTAPASAVDDFFALWTLKECEIKMNRTAGALVHRPRVKARFSAENPARLRFEAFAAQAPLQALRMACGKNGSLRASFLCESRSRPFFGRLTPETLGIGPTDADEQAEAFLAALQAFAAHARAG